MQPLDPTTGNIVKILYELLPTELVAANILKLLFDNQAIALNQQALLYGLTVVPANTPQPTDQQIALFDASQFTIGNPRELRSLGVTAQLVSNISLHDQRASITQTISGEIAIFHTRNREGPEQARRIADIYGTAFTTILATYIHQAPVVFRDKVSSNIANKNFYGVFTNPKIQAGATVLSSEENTRTQGAYYSITIELPYNGKSNY